MERYYVPYRGDKPAVVSVKGHSIIIVSSYREELERHLSEVGADRCEVLPGAETPEEQMSVLAGLSEEIKGGVVVAPESFSLDDLLKSLEGQLSWIQ
jgi:hypothetical protein